MRGGEEERRRGGEVINFGLFGWVWQGASSGCVWLVFGGIRLRNWVKDRSREKKSLVGRLTVGLRDGLGD